MVNVYRNTKKYSKTLIILQRHLPVDHSDLDSSYSTIDNIHLSSFSHHDQALESFCQKSLSFQHHDIAMTLNNIDISYEDKNKYQQALSYYLRNHFFELLCNSFASSSEIYDGIMRNPLKAILSLYKNHFNQKIAVIITAQTSYYLYTTVCERFCCVSGYLRPNSIPWFEYH
jgi:tetratricopeptide (TPR) repeat protein